MADYFFDSSGLVKRYAAEVGTAWVQSVTDAVAGNELFLSRITRAEVVAGLWRKVREGALASAAATTLTSDFRHHLQSHYRILEVRADVVDEAMLLAQRHGLRGYDAVQLATAKIFDAAQQALGIPSLTFVSADDSVLAAAQTERNVSDLMTAFSFPIPATGQETV